GVGSIEERPVIRKNKVQIRKMMTMSLAVDTEVMDMANAALMMADVKKLVESGLKGHLCESEAASEVCRMPTQAPAKNSSV
ncbi:2-oxo acid dehydrogenase subunit E2, partial [Acinetobacter baumannii]